MGYRGWAFITDNMFGGASVMRVAFHDEIGDGAQDTRGKIASAIPAIGSARKPFFNFGSIYKGCKAGRAGEKCALIIGMDFGMLAHKAH